MTTETPTPSEWTLLVGDVRQLLPTLPAASVQTCITSPPYFGLRDYGVDGQLGLEPTPDAYVEGLVAVFREVRRLLKDDGTLWLNLGDSYARAGGKTQGVPRHWDGRKADPGGLHHTRHIDNLGEGYKAKDLLGIPWRVAFALQADGWYLRQDIIWHKPNPMPESVTDRCTKAHEYIFLLSKSPRYFFDSEAMREPVSNNPTTRARNNRADKGLVGASDLHGTNFGQSGAGLYDRKQNGIAVCKCVSELDEDHIGPVTARRGCVNCAGTGLVQTRNRRSVWTVNTKPYKGAHFATFPEALIEPCVLAGSRPDDVVLDPFTGSGTTGAVALRHGRSFLGCELNPDYATLARDRIQRR